MTLILGLNLSTQIYLAGDSRLSYFDLEDEEYYVRHDNMQKVEILPGATKIIVACAGNAKFAKYLLIKIKKSNIDKSNISNFRKGLEENIGAFVNDFFTENYYSSVTLMFAGVDDKKFKKINGKKMVDLANAFTGGSGILYVPEEIRSKIEPGKKIKDEEIDLDIPDTQLFSVYADRNEVIFEDTKWGELLLYGDAARKVKEDIEDKHIAAFEFDPSMKNNGSGAGNDQALLNAFILTSAQKYNINTVGGCVLPMALQHSGHIIIVTGETFSVTLEQLGKISPGITIEPDYLGGIHLTDIDHIYRVDRGTHYRLKKVSDYESEDRESFTIL